MKIVLDSNALMVSLPLRSMFRPIFDAVISGRITLLINNEILTEYEEILCRHTTEAIATNVIEFLLVKPNVKKIEPYYNWMLIPNDLDDNKFVDTAIAGNADYIVSNDHHFNVLKSIDFPKIKIVDVETFKKILEQLPISGETKS